jgi:hypothetical protein
MSGTLWTNEFGQSITPEDLERALNLEIPQILSTERLMSMLLETWPGVIFIRRNSGDKFSPPTKGDCITLYGHGLPSFCQRKPGERIFRARMSDFSQLFLDSQVQPEPSVSHSSFPQPETCRTGTDFTALAIDLLFGPSRFCIVDIREGELDSVRKALPIGVRVAEWRKYFARPGIELRLEGVGLPDWCEVEHRPANALFSNPYSHGVIVLEQSGGASIEQGTGLPWKRIR